MNPVRLRAQRAWFALGQADPRVGIVHEIKTENSFLLHIGCYHIDELAVGTAAQTDPD